MGPMVDPSLLLFLSEWRCYLRRHSLLRVLVDRSRTRYTDNVMVLQLLWLELRRAWLDVEPIRVAEVRRRA